MKPIEIITNNFGLKVVSLVIGIALYFYTHSLIQTSAELTVEAFFSVDESVRSKTDPEDKDKMIEYKVSKKSRRQNVSLKVSGPSNKIETLLTKTIKMNVRVGKDENNFQAGSREVTLHHKDIVFPETFDSTGLKFLFLNKDQKVTVNIDELIEKPIAVKDITDDFIDSSNFSIKVKYPNPATVMVKGPRKLVETLQFVETEFVKNNIIRDASQTTIPNVRLKTLIGDDEIECRPSVVDLKLEIKEADIPETIQNVPVKYLALHGKRIDVDINPKFVNINIKGPLFVTNSANEKIRITSLKDQKDKFHVFVYVDIVENKRVPRKVMVWTDIKGLTQIKVDPINVNVLVKSK